MKNAVADDNKQGCSFTSVIGESIEILILGTFDQAVSFEFAQVVGQLIAGVLLGSEAAGIQDGLMQVGGAGSVDVR